MNSKDVESLFNNKEAYQEFHNAFLTSPQAVAMKAKIRNLSVAYKFVQAQQLQSKLTKIEYEAAKILISESAAREERVELKEQGLSYADMQEISLNVLCLEMLADCMETFVMDINDVLKRNDENLFYEDFDETVKMLRTAREHLKFIEQNSNLRKFEPWGDRCDELINQIKQTAVRIQNETREIENTLQTT